MMKNQSSMWWTILWITVFVACFHFAVGLSSCTESSVPFTNETITANMNKAIRIDNSNSSISDAVLDGNTPFCVRTDPDFYIQVDLSDIKTVKQLIIQGYTLNGRPLMLNAFVLQFSTNGRNWFKYFADSMKSPRYFLVKIRANNNTDQKIEFELQNPAIGRYMRLLPFWDQSSADREFCLRLQVFVCEEIFPPVLKTLPNVSVKLTEPFKLPCFARGQTQLHVWWNSYKSTNVYANSSTTVSLQHTLTTNLSLLINLPELSSFQCKEAKLHINCFKTYSCLANYIFHTPILQRAKTTVTIQMDFPDEISEFSVKRRQSGVTVTWKKPNLNGFLADNMLEYNLRCNTSGTPVTDVIPMNITSKFLRTNRFYFPYFCALELRVNEWAKSYFPFSIKQRPVQQSFLSFSRRPNITPAVNVSAKSSRTVRITVKAVFDRPEYGKLREYIITPIITKYGNRLPELHDIQNTRRNITVNDPHLRSYELNVKPWSLYNITVAAINNDGLVSNTGFVIVETKEEKPSSGPSLTHEAHSSQSITLSIDEFPYKNQNGEITSYQCKTQPGNKLNHFVVSKDSDPIFGIHGLKPFTTYQIKCRAHNSAGDGPYGHVYVLKTSEGLPSKPRDITTITDASNSNLLLRWQPPDPANGNITEYKIVITLTNKTKRIFSTKPDQSSIFNTKIPSVDVVQVAICAFTSQGAGESMIVPISLTNPETTPQDKNDNIVIITTFSVAIFILLVLVTLCFICFRRRFATSHVMLKDLPLEMVDQHGLSSSYPDDLNDQDYLLAESRESESDSLGIAVPNYIENTRDPIAVDHFADYVRQMKLDDYEQLLDEYKNQLMSGKCYSWVVAFLPENRPKNRYNNIAAYDHSRIKLNHDCKRKTTDYINANSINGFSFKDEQQQYKYISTQGPTEKSFADFWHMVWQENVNVIVMLTNLKENDIIKCGRYWPCSGVTSKYDSISVTVQKIDKTADYITTTLLVEKNSTKEIRTIWHFHFVSWPDHGVPDYPTALLSLQRRVRHHMQPDKPIVIHCSAGVGRSGCYILIDAMIERIDHAHTVDIFNYLRYIRTRRINMVQTFEQYIFVHEAILEYITFGNTEVVVDDLDKKTRELIRNHGMIQEYSLLSQNTQSDAADSNLYKILLHEGRYFDAYRVDGYKHREAFILTKAPKTESTPDFWKMVLEKQSHTIVMLNKCRENNEEYYKYWPDVDSECVHRDITVMMNSEVANGNIITRKIKISSNKQRCEVHHFQYVDWPETDIPNRRAYSNICTLMQAVEKSQQTLGNGPIIVHAGNDYGRSGTFVAIYNSTERLKVEQLIDVLQCIRAIRIAQPKAVDNVTQYQFVYNMLRTYLEGFENYWNYKDYKVCRSPIGSTTSAT